MQVIIAVIAVIGAAGVIVFLSSLDMNGVIKAGVAALMVFIAVYSMARIQPGETTAEKDAVK